MSWKPWRITFATPSAHTGRVEVDGRDITEELYIRRVEILAEVDDVVEVVLHCIPGTLIVTGYADDDRNPVQTLDSRLNIDVTSMGDPNRVYRRCKEAPCAS